LAVVLSVDSLDLLFGLFALLTPSDRPSGHFSGASQPAPERAPRSGPGFLAVSVVAIFPDA